MELNMTEGNITKQMISFSMPIIMGNIFQQLYNTADAVIVGHMIGSDAFAAVSVANPIMSVVLFFMVGLSMGVGVLLAQRYGAGDEEGFRTELSTALIAGVLFAAVTAALCIGCSGLMLRAVQTPAEIMEDTNAYLKVIFVGMFFSFLYNFYAAALRAIGDSRTAFLYLMLSSVVNVVLDMVLIRFTPLGVVGAALATVLSQALSVALCVVYIYRRIPMLALRKGEFVFEKRVLKDTVVFSWAAALQQTFLYFGRLLVQGTINARGTDMITGYNAAIRLEAFIMAFIDGTSAALSSFAGQNKGAGQYGRLKAGLWRTLQMNFAFLLAAGALMLGVPRLLIGLYVEAGNEAAMAIGVTYLTVMPVFYFFCTGMSALQGFFRGVGKVKITMIATFSQIIIRCVLAVLLVPRYGIYGVCISVITGWVLMFALDGTLCIRYFRREAAKN